MGVHHSRANQFTRAILHPRRRRICYGQWLECSRDMLLQWGTFYVGPLLGSR
jgi:hypothetical protein